jgi:uncharacterized protein
MLWLMLLAMLLLLAFGPQWWVRYVMRRYGRDLSDIPGTGGQLAEHLVRELGLKGVKVEQTSPFGDHYDPNARAVRLGPDNFHGRSLTAVAVAAHEVGHAMQFYHQEPVSRLRTRYLPAALTLKRVGVGLLMAMPFVLLLVRVPQAAMVMVALGILVQLVSVLMYVVVLPEEFDASFNKALPILVEGDYVAPDQVAPVRRVLRAAAMTYVAGALADVLNLGRWLAILLRR